MNYEQEILTSLVEAYRKSRKDSGQSKIQHRTQIKPEKLYKKYNANDADMDEILALNQAVSHLSQQGYVTYEAEPFGTQIRCIYLKDDRIVDAEQFLAEGCGYVSKNIRLQRMQEMVDRYRNASPICAQECAVLEKSITKRKVPKNVEELEDLLRAVSFIENNTEDMYLREASMKIYGNSKFFEENTLQPVCRLLRQYSNNSGEDEQIDEILREYHIIRKPQTLAIRGRAILFFEDTVTDISGFAGGIEFQASDLERLHSIKLLAPVFMTIENRTSYLRWTAKDTVTFYLGGYADRYQRDFLRLTAASNPDVVFRHFGDIDAGGFWIHHNLCEVTHVPFSLFAMSARELQNEAYASCLQPLTDNDRVRLRELSQMKPYAETVYYMLKHSVKLEQEIVSLEMMESDARGTLK